MQGRGGRGFPVCVKNAELEFVICSNDLGVFPAVQERDAPASFEVHHKPVDGKPMESIVHGDLADHLPQSK